MFNRIIGVFKLNVGTFEEIEHDSNATTQAAIVVAMVALLTGFGSGLGAQVGGSNFMSSFFSSLVWTFVGWVLWSVVSFFVGTTFFGGKATLSEMLRVLGFAHAPLMLGIIPCIGGIIGALWALAASFIAIRQGLDLDNLKALLTAVVGFVLVVIGNLLIASVFGGIQSIFG